MLFTLTVCGVLFSVHGLPANLFNRNISSTTVRTTPVTIREWTVATFPSPGPTGYDRLRCNRGHRGSQGSFICDPERILSQKEADRLDDRIAAISQKNPCLCGPCNTAKGRSPIMIGIMHRISPNIAILPSLRVTRFASGLRQRVDVRRDFDECGDLLYLALMIGTSSNSDRATAIAVGPRSLYRMSSRCAQEITDKATDLLRQRRHYEALDQMLSYYENAMTGGCCGTRSRLCVGQIVGIVFGVLTGLAFIVFIVVLCIGFCQDWDCVVGTCFGVCIGCLLGAIESCINAVFVSLCNSICEECGCDAECDPLDCVDDHEAEDGGGGGGTGY